MIKLFQLVGGRIKLWFEFQKVHYTFDEDKKTFRAFELDTNRPIAYFQDSKGLETDEAILEAKQDLGDNQLVFSLVRIHFRVMFSRSIGMKLRGSTS